MSDVAVTWAKAQTCMSVLKGRKGPNGVKGPDRLRVDRNAKQVLVHMASYADASGEVWAAVSVLALEMDVEERTVERGRQALIEAGLLIRTGETKVYKGKVYPMFQLPIETGHASTVRRILAEKATAQRPSEAVDHQSWGDAGVTPDDPPGVTPVSPQADTRVTPWGDTGDTQIGKGISQDLKVNAGECANAPDRGGDDAALTEAMSAWARKAPNRMAAAPVRASWISALAKSSWTSERMAGAVTACVARDDDFSRGKAVALHRWLDEERWRAWDQSADSDKPQTEGSPRAMWAGPNRVREIVGAVMGSGAVTGYLDPAGWDAERSTVLTATRMAADRLRNGVGRVLGDNGIKIEFVGSGARG